MFSIVVPFFNEEACVSDVIYAFVATIRKSKLPIRFILVNNGSVDKTGSIIKNIVKQYPELSYVYISKNKGFGYGVRKGLEQALTPYIGYMCGDGQTDPNDLISVVKILRDNPSVDFSKVVRTDRHDGWLRRYTSKIYNAFFQLLFSTTIRDINGTPKVFKRDIYKLIHPTSDDWFIDAEIMLKTQALKVKIREIQTTFYERKTGISSVKLSTAIEFIKNMLQYRVHDKITI